MRRIPAVWSKSRRSIAKAPIRIRVKGNHGGAVKEKSLYPASDGKRGFRGLTQSPSHRNLRKKHRSVVLKKDA